MFEKGPKKEISAYSINTNYGYKRPLTAVCSIKNKKKRRQPTTTIATPMYKTGQKECKVTAT